MNYILDDKRVPVEERDIFKWAHWFDGYDRTVAKTNIGVPRSRVSTVFLGVDHSFIKASPPLLFETMVFGGPKDGLQLRCSTWAEAEEQHNAVVELIKREVSLL